MGTIQSLAVTIKHFNDAIRLAKYNMAKQYGLNTSEFEVLVSLYHAGEPLSIKQLSSELLLCSQAITKICKNLQVLGLVDSSKSSLDRRITKVELTPAGNKIARIEKEYREKLLHQSLPYRNGHDLQQLETTLASMHSAAATLALEY